MILSFVFYAASLAPLTDSGKHPIDKQLEICLKQPYSTRTQAACYNTAYTAWEKDIAVSEKLLLAKEKQKDKIRAAQKAWEKERDAEFNKIAEHYNQMRGTGYISVRIKLRMEVLRKRALELEAQLKKL